MTAPPKDHVELGRALDIYTTDPLVGSGLPLWLPDGTSIRDELDRLIVRLERRAGYHHVVTPSLGKRQLYELSGHWDYYAEHMYPPMRLGEEEMVLRPVCCPHHALVYRQAQRRSRDLPVRIAELGGMYRMERSGALTGLRRVRAMTLNDAHVFCRPDQIAAEIALVLEMVHVCYDLLGLRIAEIRLSLRDEHARWAGDQRTWSASEAALRRALADRGTDFVEAPGEAAFYGPKIDVEVADATGRSSTVSTVQVDLVMPERFGLRYVERGGREAIPVMVHRSVLSTAERLVALLLEQSQGRLPFWLAPQQVWVLPVAEAQSSAATAAVDALRDSGLRARVLEPDATVGARIRQAERRRVPVVVILGAREAASGGAAVRLRGGRRVHVPLDALVAGLATAHVLRQREPQIGSAESAATAH